MRNCFPIIYPHDHYVNKTELFTYNVQGSWFKLVFGSDYFDHFEKHLIFTC